MSTSYDFIELLLCLTSCLRFSRYVSKIYNKDLQFSDNSVPGGVGIAYHCMGDATPQKPFFFFFFTYAMHREFNRFQQ